MTHPTDSASLDAMFDELWNIHRHRILVAIADHNPRTEDEFTPASLAADEADDDDRNGVNTELHNVHLPKLAEHGYIEWDAETQTIWRGPNFEEVAPLLRLVDDHRDGLPDGWLMASKQMESENAHHRKRVRQHLHEALDATDSAEKHFHIREALQLLSIEKR